MNKEEDVVAPAMATVPVPVLEAAATVAGESRPTAAVTTTTTNEVKTEATATPVTATTTTTASSTGGGSTLVSVSDPSVDSTYASSLSEEKDTAKQPAGGEKADEDISWVGVQRRSVVEGEAEKGLVLRSAGVMTPHTEKGGRGEDAFYVSSHHAGMFGVADGVGGWNEEGVDPSKFSRGIMRNAQAAMEAKAPGTDYPLRDILDGAHRATDIPGGCTALLARLTGDATLQAINLGDSGFVVIRGGVVVFTAPTQSHSFNTPFQLAQVSEFPESDTAAEADLAEFTVQAGDVIVAGSDGLFDNLWPDDIAEEVARFAGRTIPGGEKAGRDWREKYRVQRNRGANIFGGLMSPGDDVTRDAVAVGNAEGQKAPWDWSGADPEPLAERLSTLAQERAVDYTVRSPVIARAREEGALPWQVMMNPAMGGGKMDDVTAVVAMVVPAKGGV